MNESARQRLAAARAARDASPIIESAPEFVSPSAAERLSEPAEPPTPTPAPTPAPTPKTTTSKPTPPKKPHNNAHAAPAPRAKRRARQDAFLHALVRCFGNITAAAHASGIPRENHVRWHRRDPRYQNRFAKALAKAKQIKCDAIEAEIHRRGVLGWEEVTTTVEIDAEGHRKEKTVRRNLKDTVALIFSAKAEMPEKYRERTETEIKGRIDHNHEHSGTLTVAAVRQSLLNDPEYLEFQRQRALQADGALRADVLAGDVSSLNVERPLENGATPGGP